MKDLVDGLLEVARAEVDPTALQLEPLDLEMLLTEIADHCAIEALDRGCEIQLSISHAGTVIGDVDLLILLRFQDETNYPRPSGQTSQRLGICRHPREASFKLTDDCLH